MFDSVLAVAGVVAWFTGSTALHSRSRDKPIDLWLAAAILALTIISFHFYAAMSLASAPKYGQMIGIAVIDFILVIAAVRGIKRRVRPESKYIGPAFLILVGSVAFWYWYSALLGGLTPK